MSIERVLQRLGIDAKKKGSEWYALCPNPKHDDKAPSWRIRDEPGHAKHGMQNCFPCGFGGSLADLVMAVLNVEFREAMAWLGDDNAPAAKPLSEQVKVVVRRSPRGFHLPEGAVVAPLERWVTPARRYVESRFIEAWQVERWGLGYAVEGRLQGRIVVPLRNAAGVPRSYTARTFLKIDGRRYMEPLPEEKSDRSAMFGEQHWPSRGERVEKVLVVTEGALNAMAIERALPDVYVGAIAGSNLHPGHALKIASFGAVVVATDPDESGDKVASFVAASARKFVRGRLPEGVDADRFPEADLRREVLRWRADAGTLTSAR